MVRLLLSILLSCSHETIPLSDISESSAERLEYRRSFLLSKAPRCDYNGFKGPSKDTCISEGTGTGDGDMTLFGGLLCLSGYEPGCELVKRSCTDVACFRSPGRVNNDRPPTFSRDMLIGVFAYTVRTGDTSPVKVLRNRYRSDGMICESRFYCDLRVTSLGLFHEILSEHGEASDPLMYMSSFIDDESLYFSASINPIGYTMELIATQVYLRQRLQTYTATHRDVLDVLIERWPSNLYFRYIRDRANDSFVDELLLRAPMFAPERMDSWSFQTGNEERSMLWEWVYLMNLILEEHYGSQR